MSAADPHTPEPPRPATPVSNHEWRVYQGGALAVGVLCLLLSVLGWLVAPEQFFRSYLFAWAFWFSLSAGALAVAMLHHLTGGLWGAVMRRFLESAAAMIPLMVLLSAPIVLGLPQIYSWAASPSSIGGDEAGPHSTPPSLTLPHKGEGDQVAANGSTWPSPEPNRALPSAVKEAGNPEEVAAHRSQYLNVPFFLVRTLVYFAVLTLMVVLLLRWSGQQDRGDPVAAAVKLYRFSAVGVLVGAFVLSFAAVDWLMSLDPKFYSSIWGLYFIAGGVCGAFSTAIVLTVLFATRKPLAGVAGVDRRHDLGKLLSAFIMIWAYFGYSQYLLIWSGNLPEEIRYFVPRTRGSWAWVSLGLFIFGYFVPFFLLLFRPIKRNPYGLAGIALLVLAVHFADVFWMVAPTFHPDGIGLHWLDVFLPAGLGGLWTSAFLRHLRQRPLLPINDVNLLAARAEAVEHPELIVPAPAEAVPHA